MTASDTHRPSLAARVRALRVLLVAGFVLAIGLVAAYEWLYAAGVRSEHAALRDEIAQTTARNDEVERTVLSAEASAAWLEHVAEVDALWRENLKKIPPAEKVEEQYDKLAALTRRSGIRQLSFERLDVAAVAAPPGVAQASAAEPGTSVSPAIELRRVRVRFLATVESLGALLSEIRNGAGDRMLSVSEYTVSVRTDTPGYSIQVEMIVNIYFKKRDGAAAA